MGRCRSCGRISPVISKELSYCIECIRKGYSPIAKDIEQLHRRVRAQFGYPDMPPHSSNGKRCGLCIQDCVLGPDDIGYCGLGLHRGDEAGLDFYKDDLPTNCVADWVCAEGSSAHNPGCGYHNLAVFYRACNFNCLGCQNWHYRFRSRTVKVESLLSALDECTRCVCFFGGDPGPDAPYALKFTQRALRSHPGLRICWETNGSENPKIFRQMLEASLKSGGTLKVDLKAWSESVNLALCGVTNQQSLDNLRLARDWISRRPEPPLLVVSTLLVPGYIDHEELSGIANFLVGLGPEIPWALLAFYPCFYLKDLPRTSHFHARLALEIAKDAGLERVRLGNQHLLSQTYQM